MDGSDGNNAGGGSNRYPNNPQQQQQQQQQQQARVHPGESSRAVRAELEAKRRATAEKQRRYAPVAKEQMARVFGDTSPAWYARLRLLTPSLYARIAEAGVLGLSVGHDRPLSDAEARAVAEHTTAGADRMALISWGLSGAALLLTWRGRRTLRFPMWTPQVAHPPPGAYLRMAMWHGARYVAYSAALSFTVRAPLMAYNAVYEQQQMRDDPRLRWLRGDEQASSGAQNGDGSGWNDEGSAYRDDTQQQQQQQQQQQATQEATQSGWDSYYKQAGQQPQQPQQQYGQSTRSQESAGWGSSYSQSPSSSTQLPSSAWDSADVDDASPIASSAQNTPYGSTGGGGSTWERLRQQSQRGSQQQQQQQRSPPPPPPPQSTGGNWGDSGDGADRAAQEKAQRDFDELVERDRQGQGQGRSGWGGR
ncbi:hypothetical protein IF1G_03198 [Cordyceps javanica]|uniref:Uncharacterized protein n=1 Tax=Cordyceps javanica TaxID=43265 RepID=A0A545V6X9_9HYPO|nr:hypothetical protein IF1G_03198 [Cordyceps javanica]TQW09360.1 hypothetical protein IF2G_03791 [Cordyceps javanica]